LKSELFKAGLPPPNCRDHLETVVRLVCVLELPRLEVGKTMGRFATRTFCKMLLLAQLLLCSEKALGVALENHRGTSHVHGSPFDSIFGRDIR
jgi:hypothetical protein